MPRIDFPVFDGSRANAWLDHCNYYFDVYQTQEMYKTRLATMSFVGDASEWYECYRVENPNPPWPILVEAVFERFKVRNIINPVVQFRRTQQTEDVEEYMKEFQRAKARLLADTGIKNEFFYLWSFISGLKEEIQNSINLFKPKTLNEAFNLALELEMVVGPTDKKLSIIKPQNTFSFKPSNFQNFKPAKALEGVVKKTVDTPPTYKPPIKPQNHLTLDQKRAMGLCFRCNDKWSQGHKCPRRVHVLEGEGEEESNEETSMEGYQEEEMVEGEEGERGEQHQIVTLSAFGNNEFNKTLQYKGQISHIPISILVDSGATHSFIDPFLVETLNIPTKQSPKLNVSGAWGNRVITNTQCQNVKFQIQNHPFEAENLMVLKVRGYDLVLGYDWIAGRDIDLRLGKGLMSIESEGKMVNLVTEDVKAQIRICEGEVDLMKEYKKGSQIFYAQLFLLKDSGTDSNTKLNLNLHPNIDQALQQFPELFEEPKTLPPKRPIDHKIMLKPESKPFTLRPYIFSFFQKTEIEKIVQELLN